MSGDFREKFTSERQDDILAFALRNESFYRSYFEYLRPEFFEAETSRLVAESHRKIFVESGTFPDKASVKNQVLLGIKNHSKYKHEEKIIEKISRYVDAIYDLEEAEKGLIEREILDFAKSQAFKIALLDSLKDVEQGQYELVKDKLLKALDVSDDPNDCGLDYFSNFEQRLDNPKLSIKPVTTGFKTLDRYTNGGLDVGCLGVAIASPKSGKSTFLINLGYAALIAGRKVLHYTLEISPEKIARRYDSRATGVRINNIGKPGYVLEVKKKLRQIQRLTRGRLVIKGYPSKAATVNTFLNHAYRLASKQNFKPDLILVDYGDIVKPISSFKEERHSQASVYEALRTMAAELQVPVWTASQCNRKATNKHVISMEDIAESYQKVAIADIVIAICRSPIEVKDGFGRLYIAGSREGRDKKSIRIKVDFARSLMQEISDE
jgi:replicative DNA helicase